MTQDENAIVETQKAGLPIDMNALFDEQDMEADYEHLGADDFVLPRLELMQFTSPSVRDQTATAGQMLNSLTLQMIADSDEPVVIIPLRQWKTRIRWFHRDAKETGIQCRSIDYLTGTGDPGGSCIECPLSKWTKKKDAKAKDKKNIPPLCTESINFACLLPDFAKPHDVRRLVWIPFQKTSHPIGRTLIQVSGSVPGRIFTRAYQLGRILATNAKGEEYFEWTLEKWAGLNRYDHDLRELYPETWGPLVEESMARREFAEQVRGLGKIHESDEAPARAAPGETSAPEPETAGEKEGSGDDVNWGE